MDINLATVVSRERKLGIDSYRALPSIVLKDGTRISIQVGRFCECLPKGNTGMFTHVEVASLTSPPNDSWEQYADVWSVSLLDRLENVWFWLVRNPAESILTCLKHKTPCVVFSKAYARTVVRQILNMFKDQRLIARYSYVPVPLVAEYILAHGGIDKPATFATFAPIEHLIWEN